MKEYTKLDDFLADLPSLAEQFREKLAGQDALFCLKAGARQVYVKIADGGVQLLDECAEKPAATVAAEEAALMDMLAGRLNPMVAMFTGKVQVTGNLGALTGLMTLLKG